ncbi:Diphthamide biosynthesis protein 2 [Komagataella phaffii CBS 7435]|uniref:2-(3-amino-3-carboxypropyl)histidine synthase subunit 2 n=2 Tax=Komagataella phaffii TaxID=460519 RepID=C4R157_KOMPG|nr:Protein required, along with Dph1p, Kti11p, Jjj3p, and Dph5p, for synthesis of diphthamide [Komagataella phaffii GS115]AOA62989.1 GQ67_00650T0 [Komagataella phaffii]CAH2448243.1 Diphthamide biosynthesis protein 2 [Komagataella phaffii CBS 7435]AOA67572.1 GQ68_00738T0 [Komagataella phaffii GS115]CAY69231.1 Protein required, along with Dph1p, Kti11p, Jjj3p, and Dph5p, for synthesis of diphthamide [Komagataella phaffii GS115]CCA38378.1 Diphthamide biosynthesis protein 2 [Komagataella phaffii C
MSQAPALSTHQEADQFQYSQIEEKRIERYYLGEYSDLKQRIIQFYDLDELKTKLQEKDNDGRLKYKNITLQFPDSLIADSSIVLSYLQESLVTNEDCSTKSYPDVEEIGCKGCVDCDKRDKNSKSQDSDKQAIWILADTAYSSCCIDEVASGHVNGDVVVHFGDACLNPIDKLNALYVFGKPHLNAEKIIERVEELCLEDDKVVLMSDTPYSYNLYSIYRELKPKYPNLAYADVDFDLQRENMEVIGKWSQPQDEDSIAFANRRIFGLVDEISNYKLFHITLPADPRLLFLSTNFSSVEIFDCKENCTVLGPFPSLMKRYKHMHVGRTAGTIGILINTLSLANTKIMLNTVIKAIRAAGKKHYIFVVGKPNVAKLANFDPIDIWCILGCGQSGIVIDNVGDYYKPIITPYELQLALKPEVSWTGRWVTDFMEVIENGEFDLGNDEDTENDIVERHKDDAPEFDAVTGKFSTFSRPLRQLKHLDVEVIENQDETALVKKFSSNLAIQSTVSTSAKALQERSWTGLGSDFKDLEEYGAALEEGRNGIARDYGL